MGWMARQVVWNSKRRRSCERGGTGASLSPRKGVAGVEHLTFSPSRCALFLQARRGFGDLCLLSTILMGILLSAFGRYELFFD